MTDTRYMTDTRSTRQISRDNLEARRRRLFAAAIRR